jgi:hypothetical protein
MLFPSFVQAPRAFMTFRYFHTVAYRKSRSARFAQNLCRIPIRIND